MFEPSSYKLRGDLDRSVPSSGWGKTVLDEDGEAADLDYENGYVPWSESDGSCSQYSLSDNMRVFSYLSATEENFLDLGYLPPSRVWLDESMMLFVISRTQNRIALRHKYWPASFDQNGDVRANRLRFGAAPAVIAYHHNTDQDRGEIGGDDGREILGQYHLVYKFRTVLKGNGHASKTTNLTRDAAQKQWSARNKIWDGEYWSFGEFEYKDPFSPDNPNAIVIHVDQNGVWKFGNASWADYLCTKTWIVCVNQAVSDQMKDGPLLESEDDPWVPPPPKSRVSSKVLGKPPKRKHNVQARLSGDNGQPESSGTRNRKKKARYENNQAETSKRKVSELEYDIVTESEDDRESQRQTISIASSSITSRAASPINPGAASPSGSGAASPSGSGAASPSGSGAVTPINPGAASPSDSGAASPNNPGAAGSSDSERRTTGWKRPSAAVIEFRNQLSAEEIEAMNGPHDSDIPLEDQHDESRSEIGSAANQTAAEQPGPDIAKDFLEEMAMKVCRDMVKKQTLAIKRIESLQELRDDAEVDIARSINRFHHLNDQITQMEKTDIWTVFGVMTEENLKGLEEAIGPGRASWFRKITQGVYNESIAAKDKRGHDPALQAAKWPRISATHVPVPSPVYEAATTLSSQVETTTPKGKGKEKIEESEKFSVRKTVDNNLRVFFRELKDGHAS